MSEPSSKNSIETTDIFEKLFDPEVVDSLFFPYTQTSIEIQVFRNRNEPSDTIELTNLYPFFTIQDLKLEISEKISALGSPDAVEYAPMFQFLGIPYDAEGNEITEPETPGDFYDAVDYTFTKKGSPSVLHLRNPFDSFSSKKWDRRFVDSTGTRETDLQNNPRHRVTLEDAFLKPRGGTFPVLHLFLYNRLRRFLPEDVKEAGRLSESEYQGRVFNYFPTVSRKQDGDSLTPDQEKLVKQSVTFHSKSKEFIHDVIEPLVTDYDFPVKPKIKDVNLLQLLWVEKMKEKTLDLVFYQTSVNQRRPYVRLYPMDNIPISKIHVKGVLPIPDISDPCLLLQWSKEKNPLQGNDYLLSKIKIDPYYEDRNPIYATLQLASDGTARAVIEPPKKLEKLDPNTDLKFLKENLMEGIHGLPFESSRLDIDESNVTAILNVPPIGAVGKKELFDRLTLFKPFFQNVDIPTEEAPLLSLRYRAVSNFTTEDALHLYFTVLAAQKKLPEYLPQEMIDRIRKKYSIASDEEVIQKFDDWKIKKDEVDTVSTENSIYKRKYNRGIDISIFFHQSKYIFKIYRVDSYLNLQRILTLLTLMLSVKKADLQAAAQDSSGSLEEVERVRKNVESSNDSSSGSPSDLDAAFARRGVTAAGLGIGKSRLAALADSSSEDSSSETTPEEAPPPKPKSKPGVAEEKVEQKFSGNLQKYIIERLQKTDPELFVFSTKAGEKSYVQGCQVNDGKQPISLDTTAYDRMVTEYRKDVIAGKMDIITYNYKKGFERLVRDKIKFASPTEEQNRTFILLQYGTDVTNLNYYFCPEYFCIRDNIVVRKDELLGKAFRNDSSITRAELKGRVKEPGRCPFCDGKVIKNPGDRKADEFVLHRRPKAEGKKDDIKTFINFYSKRIHPNEWIMPCCGKKPTAFNLRDKSSAGILMNDAFKKLEKLSATVEKTAAKLEGREERDETYPERRDVREDAVAPNYQDFLQRLPQQYIIKEDAIFLDVTPQKPQIGLLPTIVSEYFLQDNKSLLEKATTLTKIRPNSQGFLRVGVANLQGRRQESFFSAIAPFLFRNSADEVRELFRDKITARVFLAANYGNLMMEFYNPNFPEREIPRSEIEDFASTKLKIKGNISRDDQLPYIKRIYRAYLNFKGEPDTLNSKEESEKLEKRKVSFLDDKLQVKEYRQFASILAQPGLIVNRGIVFVVVEITSENKLRILCPPYGFTKSMEGCDIGILLKQGDIWEPVFFYQAKPLEPGQDRPKHNVILRFQRALRSSKDQAWPKILIQRVEEFQRQCTGPDSALYTGIARLKEGSTLMSLSKIVKLFVDTDKVYGVVRDTFNHIVAALFKSEPDRESSPLIAVPVKDDGIIRQEIESFLNWDGFEAAPADKIVDFYRKYKQPLGMFPGYRPKFLVTPAKSKKVEAIQLSSGIFIPAAPSATDRDLGLETLRPLEIEWTINKTIMLDPTSKSSHESLRKIETDKQLEETFEHFRLSFMNWFAGKEDGAGQVLRKEIYDIINPATRIFGYQLPLYEKRRRLEILLGPTLMKWVEATEKGPNIFGTLLRVDCRQMKAEDCKLNGACYWEQTKKGSGVCKIHAPAIKENTNPKEDIDVSLLFLYKLIEELIRFPPRRDQLLQEDNRHVSKLVAIKTALRLGNTYIIPENSIEWSDLLRMECKRKTSEKAKFFEEMSAASGPPPPPKDDPEKYLPIPTDLEEILFGEDPVQDKYRLFAWNRSQVKEGMDIQALLLQWDLGFSELGIEKDSQDARSMAGWSMDTWRNLVRLLRKGVIYIDIPRNSIAGLRFVDPDVYVIVHTGEDDDHPEATQVMILKDRREISSIKERLLPKYFQEEKLVQFKIAKPKKDSN
jgi:hypothetical protein